MDVCQAFFFCAVRMAYHSFLKIQISKMVTGAVTRASDPEPLAKKAPEKCSLPPLPEPCFSGQNFSGGGVQ